MMNIVTEKFQGPLGLLLQLIEKEELDITEIGLAKIADQYIEYIHQNQTIDPDQMADFLVVAAKLLYIKSKALLPYINWEDEEEDFDDLEKQLRMYKEFIDASKNISKLLAKKRFSFAKDLTKISRRSKLFSGLESFIEPKGLKAEILQQQFLAILQNLAPKEEQLKEERVEYKISLEERISYIQKLLVEKIQFNFSNILRGAKSKIEVIVNFLAILELAKQKELDISQDDLFHDISVNYLR